MASLNSVLLSLLSILLLAASGIISEATTTHPMRSRPAHYISVAIAGQVFCKSCKYRGYLSSIDASPLSGALVKVTCYYSTRSSISMAATTGTNGSFYLTWPNIALFSQKKCRAYLSWSPFTFCKKPIYQNSSISFPLNFDRVRNMTHGNQAVYSCGMLLYGATANNTVCHVYGS